MTSYMFKYRIFLKQALQGVLSIAIFFCMNNTAHAQQQEMMVRISEIEIHSEYLEEYKTILKHEAEASVRLEKGVIAILPMFQKENPTQVRILEMYQDQKAYQSHLKTKHFLKYKTTTLHMVKTLKLVDMNALDPEMIMPIFRKMSK
jgi:quinol monooxygenase YgiN